MMQSTPATNYPFSAIHDFFVASIPDMPPEFWWIAAALLLVLCAAAAVDLFKGVVPDPLIFFGMAGIVAAKGVLIDWPFAAHQMTWGLVAMAIVWGINEIWFRLFKHDALGLGDAKWSMLAVTGFGALPVVLAWGVGAVLGAAWIAAQKLSRRKQPYVHFAPFLFAGLVAGIWAVRIQGLHSLLGFHAP
jgi:prepilin signal peptidase PulO-like enzyme (type II secretory pathway)